MQNNENIFYKHTDGTTYDYGRLYDLDGKNYDITIILNNNPTAFDDDSDDDQTVRLIDFYFGDPDNKYTEIYVKQYIEKQNKFNKLLVKLYDLEAKNPDDTELAEHIKFVQSQIHKLY